MSKRNTYYWNNREKILLQCKINNARKRAQLTEEQYIAKKIKDSIYNKEYYEQNKERLNEKQRQRYIAKNPDHYLEKMDKLYSKEPTINIKKNNDSKKKKTSKKKLSDKKPSDKKPSDKKPIISPDDCRIFFD